MYRYVIILIFTACLFLFRIGNTDPQNVFNTSFYEELGSNKLSELAVKSGLTSGEDIKRIFPYINEAKIILEIGAGMVEQLILSVRVCLQIQFCI